MSLWETQEVQDELYIMWEAAQDVNNETDGDFRDENNPDARRRRVEEEKIPDPDEEKPRASVKQYAALIAHKVMTHLEGLAQARIEKRPRPYQTDAEIHQSYISATSGGGAKGPEDEPDEGPQAGEAPQKSREVFPLLRGDFDTEEMRAILDFEHKPRPTPLLKELLSLPFIDKQALPPLVTEKTDRHRAEAAL